MPTAVPKIKLRSSNGEVLEIYRDVVKLSELIMEKLENRESGDEEPVDLHVDSGTLKVVIEFCEHHKDDDPESREVRQDGDGDFIIDPWDKALLEVLSSVVFNRVRDAATYLRIQHLKDVVNGIFFNRLF